MAPERPPRLRTGETPRRQEAWRRRNRTQLEHRREAARRWPACDSRAMLLYNSMVSGNCYKVRLLLAHLGLPVELRELDVIDRSNRPDVLGGLESGASRPDARPRRRPADRRVGRDPLVLRRGLAIRPGRSVPARAGAAVDVLRAVRPRAEHRGRAIPDPVRRSRARSSTRSGCRSCTRAVRRRSARWNEGSTAASGSSATR